MNRISIYLCVFAFVCFAAVVAAGQDGRILVAGDPPLTRRTADAILLYYGRALMLDFSDEQRSKLEQRLVANWKNARPAERQGLAKFIKTVQTINAWDHDKLERVQGELETAVLADLRSSGSNDFNRLILDIYAARGREEFGADEEGSSNAESRKPEVSDGDTSKETFTPVTGVGLASLAGKWVKGSVSSYGYRNTVTNDYRSAHGAANEHDIRPNGTFDYSNFASISGYGCTTELFTTMKGRISISGSRVTFTYLSGTVRGKDSCKSTGFTRPAEIKPSTYELQRSNGKLRLCEIGTEAPYCLYKEGE
jgi:hypothetical protein